MGVPLHHGPPLFSHLRVHLSFALSGLSTMTTALQQGKRYHVFCCACYSYFRNTVSADSSRMVSCDAPAIRILEKDCPHFDFLRNIQQDFLYRTLSRMLETSKDLLGQLQLQVRRDTCVDNASTAMHPKLPP